MAIRKYVIKDRFSLKHIVYASGGQKNEDRIILDRRFDDYAFANKIIPADKKEKLMKIINSDGFINIRIPTKRKILYITDNKEIIVNPGEYLLVDHDGYDQIRSIGEGKEEKRTMLSLNKKLFEEIFNAANLKLSINSLIFKLGVRKRNDKFNGLIRSLFDAAESKIFGNEVLVQTILMQFSLYLLNNHKNNTPKLVKELEQLKYQFHVKRAMDFIRDSFNKDFSLDDLSKEACINKVDLIRLFKKETGKTPFEYLADFRIEKAKKLLKNKSNLISDICLKTGFTDLSYFSASFKKITGKSPSDYREEILK